MTRGYVFWLTTGALFVGSQFLFIRVAVREVEPAAVADLRLWIAAPVIVGAVLLLSGAAPGRAELRRAVRPGIVVGLLNAVPFTLIAWAETRVDSGIAAVAVATVPVFVVALAAAVVPSQRVAGLQLAGFLLALAGVTAMAGLHPDRGRATLLGITALLVAALSFAGSQVYSQLRIEDVSGRALAAVGMSVAAVLLLPFAIAQPPRALPEAEVVGSIIALALVSTVGAQLVFYRMIASYGVTRTTVGGYLVPVVALVLGALFLDETLTGAKLLGLVLILAGVALGSGLVGRHSQSRLAIIRRIDN